MIARYIFDILASSVGLFIFFNGILELKRNKLWTIYFVFYFLFVLPLFVNFFLKVKYDAGYWYGYIVMQDDLATAIIYDICTIIVSLFFYFILTYKFKETEDYEVKISDSKKTFIKYSLIVFSVMPVFLFFAFSVVGKYNPLLIFKLNWRYLYDAGKIPEMLGYGAAERLTYIGASCSLVLIFNLKFKPVFIGLKTKEASPKNVLFLLFKVVFLFSLLAFSILIEGKRSIFLFVGVVVIICIIYKMLGKVKTWVVIALIISLLALAISSYILLASGYRTSAGTFNPKTYAAIRVDIFRDQSLKFVIYSILHSNEVRILSFPGQSYLTEVFYLFPIVYIPIKFKTGYETYFTAAEMFSPISMLDNTRLTNSGLDEMLANFSFFGLLVFFVMLFFVLKKMYKSSPETRIFITIAFVLFMMYSTSYVCWFYEFLIALYIVLKLYDKIEKRIKLKVNEKRA